MVGDDVAMFLYSDLSGVARGRGFPATDLGERMRTGVGWVPADQALTPTGAIADPNPWGSMGDLRLLADPESRVHVDYGELGVDAPTLHFYLCDAVTPELESWDACVRAFCKDALEALRATTGLEVVGAFEQEFHLSGPEFSPGVAFSMDAYRRAGNLGPLLVGALRAAGQEPETVLPEYGSAQYEINCRPAVGVRAADRAAAVREITRDVARQLGLQASFAPVFDPDDAANGVHVHLSLRASDGRPATYDPAGRARLSEPASAFAAGVLAAASPTAGMVAEPATHDWTVSQTPNPGYYGNIVRGITARTASDAWAVGVKATETSNDTLALHWDGTSWSTLGGGTSSFAGGPASDAFVAKLQIPTRFQEDAATYTGRWASYGAETGTFSGGTMVASNEAGATATFSFTGTAVTWIGVKCSICGIATVSIDGGLPTTVNTAGPASSNFTSEPVFSASGLDPGVPHTMVITVTGTTTSVQAAPFGSHVAVDAFDVTQ